MLKPGDVVQLKSGGPNMTVMTVGAFSFGEISVCYFNSDGEFRQFKLPDYVLKKL